MIFAPLALGFAVAPPLREYFERGCGANFCFQPLLSGHFRPSKQRSVLPVYRKGLNGKVFDAISPVSPICPSRRRTPRSGGPEQSEGFGTAEQFGVKLLVHAVVFVQFDLREHQILPCRWCARSPWRRAADGSRRCLAPKNNTITIRARDWATKDFDNLSIHP